MAKDIEDINISFQGVIDTLLSQKAAFETKFNERMAEIYDEIEGSPNIKYLNISRKIKVYTDWIIQMMVNNSSIIRHQQEYLKAILENLDLQEADSEEYEAKLNELEEMTETLRSKIKMLEREKVELAREIEGRNDYEQKEKEAGKKAETTLIQKSGDVETQWCGLCHKKRPLIDFDFYQDKVRVGLRKKNCRKCLFRIKELALSKKKAAMASD